MSLLDHRLLFIHFITNYSHSMVRKKMSVRSCHRVNLKNELFEIYYYSSLLVYSVRYASRSVGVHVVLGIVS